MDYDYNFFNLTSFPLFLLLSSQVLFISVVSLFGLKEILRCVCALVN